MVQHFLEVIVEGTANVILPEVHCYYDPAQFAAPKVIHVGQQQGLPRPSYV